jgi:integrase
VKGHLQRRGPTVWRLYVELARDPNTKRRRQFTKTFHGTRRAAESALAQFVTEAIAGRYDKGDETVGELVDRWLRFKAPNLTPNTLRGYRSKIDTIIVPELGDKKLAKLTTRDLDDLYARLGQGCPNRKPLAANSIGHVHAILHAALNQAIVWEEVTRNVAARATPPSVEPKDDPDLDPDMILKVLQAAPTDTLGDIAYLAAVTGLRVGELCGLRWGDLDTTARTLAVRRRVMIDGTVRAKTKNERSRALGLDRRSVARLRLRHVHARRRARMCKVELTERSYIFSEVPDGLEPLRPGIVSQRWTKHRIRMGVDLTFHGLRHASASLLLHDGAQLGRVSKRLGHTRPSTTSDIYAHVLNATDHDLSVMIARRLR